MTSIFKRYRGDREIPFEKEDPNLIEDLERSYGIDLVEADIGDALQLLRDLIDEAMERQHISSHNKLSQILEIDRSTFSHWIHGRNLPSEKIILKLAALADADPDEALLIHRILHASTPDTKNTYHTMLRLIWSVKHAAAVLVLLFCLGGIHQVTAGTGIEQISLVDLHSVYYGKYGNIPLFIYLAAINMILHSFLRIAWGEYTRFRALKTLRPPVTVE